MTRVLVLGGGPAGVGAAWRLRERTDCEVRLLERNDWFGGNSGSFEWNGHWLDYGSHRLHPATEPAILADVRSLLGEELLDRPRHGRIRLLGRWVHFPLKPADLLLHLDRSFALGSLADALRKAVAKPDEGDTFASVLRANLGPTICEHFYFPYARKLWGHEPEELSAIQARRRVSAGSFGKLARKVLSSVPGLKPPGAGRFFYPRKGFGQISRGYARRAVELGADLRLDRTVTRIRHPEGPGAPFVVEAEGPDGAERHEADLLWSTIPITLVARLSSPEPPAEVLEAARSIDYRAMLLVYLELPVERFTEFDAHYFPGEDVAITRLSEPKNYAARDAPSTTVLCAELPCARGGEHWEAPDAELARIVEADLERSGLPLPAAPVATTVRRLPQAYPVYRNGYEAPFGTLDAWIEGRERLLSFGRQGLFAHDNTHHALYMAYSAVDCLRDGAVDEERWADYRELFRKHVVED